MLTEDVVKHMLREAGLPVPAEGIATSAEEARALASGIGYPLAMKIISPDVPHRAKVGGLALGIGNEDEVVAKFAELTETVRARVPGASIQGILLQKMIPPGPELLLGMSRDTSFGPILTFGMGGILTEALSQATFAALPVSAQDARHMIEEVPAARTLLSFNAEAHDAVIDLITSLSDWCVRQGNELLELDLNPVILHEGKPMLVDGLAVIAGGMR